MAIITIHARGGLMQNLSLTAVLQKLAVAIQIDCDVCGRDEMFVGQSFSECEAQAAQKGWSIEPSKVCRCSRCACH